MIKNLNLKSDIFKILALFLIWRITLIGILLLSINFIPLGSTDRFLGGGPLNFYLAPELFSWANFDGEHYLSIAIFGYKQLEQAFFPVFPLLISFFSKPFFSSNLLSSITFSTMVGLFISNISFLIALIFLYKLLLLDFSKKITFFTLSLLLLFPTSFYFGSLYNESLFLALSLGAFYFIRKRRYFLASVLGCVASATRVFGVLLLPAILIEFYQRREKFSKWFWILFIPLGLGGYMIYQYISIGDPLSFYKLQEIIGNQHKVGITLLPQVYFRYLKILLTLDPQNPIYQTILLEFLVGIVFFILPIMGYFKKIRLSYLFYAMAGFLLPTIQGSFSSLPRYVIILFPSFLVLALIFEKLNLFLKIITALILTSGLIIETTLFLRGYWVA